MSRIVTEGTGVFFASGGLPSPSPTMVSSQSELQNLPHPRSRSLQPGSKKEDLVRRYLEEQLLYISRRYVKKFGGKRRGEDIEGYQSFTEVCVDFNAVINVLWLSGTPSLQIPFLFRIASDYIQYVRAFPPTPKPALLLLTKLDHCFSSLLLAQDVKSGETLPGFENGSRVGMTTTDMVRCRSLVEQTRILMVEILGDSTGEDDIDDEAEEQAEEKGEGGGEVTGDMETSDAGGTRTADYSAWGSEEEKTCLDVARIYVNTIIHLEEQLGDVLHAPGPSTEVGCGVGNSISEASKPQI